MSIGHVFIKLFWRIIFRCSSDRWRRTHIVGCFSSRHQKRGNGKPNTLRCSYTWTLSWMLRVTQMKERWGNISVQSCGPCSLTPLLPLLLTYWAEVYPVCVSLFCVHSDLDLVKEHSQSRNLSKIWIYVETCFWWLISFNGNVNYQQWGLIQICTQKWRGKHERMDLSSLNGLCVHLSTTCNGRR